MEHLLKPGYQHSSQAVAMETEIWLKSKFGIMEAVSTNFLKSFLYFLVKIDYKQSYFIIFFNILQVIRKIEKKRKERGINDKEIGPELQLPFGLLK